MYLHKKLENLGFKSQVFLTVKVCKKHLVYEELTISDLAEVLHWKLEVIV